MFAESTIKVVNVCICFLSILFPAAVYSADFSARGDYDNTTKSLTPSYSLEWFWNNTFSSGIDAKYAKDIVLSDVQGFSPSKDATEIKLWDLRTNVLSWNFKSDGLTASVGGTGSFEYIKKKEFGYFQLPASMGSTWVTFDNNIDIAAYMPCLTVGAKYITAWMNAAFRCDLFPSYLLSVEQDTCFNPIVSSHAASDDSKWQKPGYSLRLDLAFKTSPWIFADLVVRAESSYIRTDYSLNFLHYDGAWGFRKGSADISTLDNSIIAAFAVSNGTFGDVTPLVGFGRSWETLHDYKAHSSETEGQWIVTFGADSKVDFSQK